MNFMKQEKPKHKRNKKELKPLYRYINATERKRKTDYRSFTEQLSEGTHMTGDMIAGQPMLSMMGNHSITISNYQSILEYSTEQIRISTKKYPVTITGEKLCIRYSMKDEIKIAGNIFAVSYQKQ